MLPPPKTPAETLALFRRTGRSHDYDFNCDPLFGHDYCIGWANSLLKALAEDMDARTDIAKALAPEVYALAEQLIWEEPSGEEALAGVAGKCRFCSVRKGAAFHEDGCPGTYLWSRLDGKAGGQVREMR